MPGKPPPKLSRTQTVGVFAIPPKPKTEDQEKSETKSNIYESLVFCTLVILFEAGILSIFSVWFTYPRSAESEEEFDYLYNLTRDVSIMIFFGFGFLMTFLRRYGYSAVGYTFLISALVVQWSIIVGNFFHEVDHDPTFSYRRAVGVMEILDGLFCAGSVMISYGAVLGKVTPLQLTIMAFIEPIFYWVNIYICSLKLDIIDIGGGYFIHMFGAYFGLAVCFFLTSKKTHGHPDNTSCYSSDLFSFAGTLFLWLLWPSFNAVIAAPGRPRLRAAVNTFLSLCGATVCTFVFSRLVSEHKFNVIHIQNSTLAGGVVMGIAAHLQLFPATALGVGMLAGFISVLGYRYLTPFMNNYLHIQDICGVHNLHGMPSILGAILSIFATLGLSQVDIDNELYPQGDWQPFFQLAGIGITLGIALLSGTVCGIIMWAAQFIHSIYAEDLYNDRTFWELPSDYEHVVRDSGNHHDDEDGEEMDDNLDGVKFK